MKLISRISLSLRVPPNSFLPLSLLAVATAAVLATLTLFSLFSESWRCASPDSANSPSPFTGLVKARIKDDEEARGNKEDAHHLGSRAARLKASLAAALGAFENLMGPMRRSGS